MKIEDYNINLYYLLSSLVLVLGFTLVGAGPIKELSFVAGFLFWLVHISTAVLLYVLVTIKLTPLLSFQKSRLKGFFLASAIAALGFGMLALFLETPFFHSEISTENVLDEIFPAASQSFVFWTFMNMPILFKGREKRLRKDNQRSSLLLYIDSLAMGDPYFIKSEGNYIRIFFREDSFLYLYGLKDAVAELSEGFQCHRSYWVNKKFILKRIYKNKMPFLVLSSGQQIPIGRTFFKDVKENTNYY